MQGYLYDIWTIKFWTVKSPGNIWIVEMWTVKTGLRLQLRLGLVMTVQIMTVQLRHVTREQQHHFLAHVYCRQTVGWIKMPFGMDYGGTCRPRSHCDRWEPSSPIRGTAAPKISVVYCGQMAGWIKMPLGTEVGLSAGNIVLDDTYR